MPGYDIVGDIHGQADKLEHLLRKLGYAERNGAWRHPSREAIFVGDLIDRGPGQLRTLNIVRRMIDAGSARAVMGNHEFNAIGWATPHPDEDGRHLRARHGEKGEKNRHQHEAFLGEVGSDSATHLEWIEWFKSLPIWVEEPNFRVVHACWSPVDVDGLRPELEVGDRLSDELIVKAHERGSSAYLAVETLLKGTEITLPHGVKFTDKDGHVRKEIRTRWWDPAAHTYRDAYIGPPGVEVPNQQIENYTPIPTAEGLTFIGHYWLPPEGPFAPLSEKVVCVDYSAAKGGPLVAYRFDGEAAPAAEHFFC